MEKPKKPVWRFSAVFPADAGPGPWITVTAARRGAKLGEVAYVMQVKLRSVRGELSCIGLRIGEGAGPWGKTGEDAITRRGLCGLPLGEMLRFLQGLEDANEGFEHPLPFPLGARGTKREDEFYIQQAELFAKFFARYRTRRASERALAAYRSVAKETDWAESTVRRQVQRGWKLGEERGLNLKPDGIRTRKPKETP